jgi:hypothetical protein
MATSKLQRTFTLTLSAGLVTFTALATPALAQDEPSSPSISVGSSRIGGPGTSEEQRQAAAESYAEEETFSEDTLPPKDSKKRMPALHVLARQYHGGKMWKEACGKFDTILDEGGEAALDTDPEGRTRAAQSYYGCAKDAVMSGDHDKANALLAKSERFAPTTAKHAALREKMLRDQYKKKVADGDLGGAVALFEKAQAMRADEDERIWMGEELAKAAWAAFQSKQKVELDVLLAKLEQVAPMNTEYRRLKDKIAANESTFANAFGLGAIAVLVVLAATALSRWRAQARVRRAAGHGFEDL